MKSDTKKQTFKKDKNEVAISVQNVSKSFKLYHEKRGSLRDIFYHLGRGSSYEKFDALKNISFEVNKGEFLGIIGRNGSGKSTLLKLLAGVYLPDTGKISVNGRLIPFLELGVGFNPELTGRENVFLNGTIMGLTKSELQEKFDEIIDFAEVREFIDMPLKKYSSGMQVRLAFSIAIQADADIYLLDEILAVGDANFQAKSMAEFRKFKEKGKTVILVTHDLGALAQYCDKAIYIKDHVIEAQGDPSDLLNEYIYLDRDNSSEDNTSSDEETAEDGDTKKEKNPYAEVKKVEFFDKKNSKNKMFLAGDDIQIEVTYKVKKTLETPVFGIALYKDDGTHLLGDNTDLSNAFDKKSIDPGTYKVRVTIPNMPLLKGNVLLTIAITDKTYTKTYIWEEKKYEFSVVSGKLQSGLLLTENNWQVTKV